jgi:uncharacterized membrane protein YphA (DoxX/SURF4 family)
MKPEPNALTDTIAFLTKPEWPTAVYWLMLIVSCNIALRAWRGGRDQQTGYAIGRWVLNIVVGTMWWQGSLWKIPPNFDGLQYFVQEIVDHAAIPFQAAVFRTVVLPNIAVFGWVVYLTEAFIGASLILGVLTGPFALLGLAMAVNLWLGLYSAPGEWPWTYGYLVVLQAWFVIDPPGRYLGYEGTGLRRFT